MNEIYDWVNQKGLTGLESALRVMSVCVYTICLFNPPINSNGKVR